MARMATRESMGSVYRGEGRIALAASKPTTIALRRASLDEGSFTGEYGWKPPLHGCCSHSSPLLAFPLAVALLAFSMASLPMVIMLENSIASDWLVQTASKVLADWCLRPPSTMNAGPPVPYMASSLSSPYFKYTNIWMYGTQSNLSWMVSRWAISPHLRMVTYGSRQLKVSWFSAKTKWTFISSLAMPIFWACHSNYWVNSLIAIPTWHIMAMPRYKFNSLHWSQSQMCSTT